MKTSEIITSCERQPTTNQLSEERGVHRAATANDVINCGGPGSADARSLQLFNTWHGERPKDNGYRGGTAQEETVF